MPRYEQTKALKAMLEITSIVDVFYDLAVVCRVISDNSNCRHEKEFWLEMFRLCEVAESHAQTNLEFLRKKGERDVKS